MRTPGEPSRSSRPKPGFAREWARVAKAAGARYVVFTTKHHDGFALHDSAVSDYDAGSVLHRDLVKEIVEAFRAERPARRLLSFGDRLAP